MSKPAESPDSCLRLIESQLNWGDSSQWSQYDFQKLSLLNNMKNNQQFKSMIIELGQDVYKRYEVFTKNNVNPWGNCQNHQLPTIQEVKQLLQSESEQFVNRNG